MAKKVAQIRLLKPQNFGFKKTRKNIDITFIYKFLNKHNTKDIFYCLKSL